MSKLITLQKFHYSISLTQSNQKLLHNNETDAERLSKKREYLAQALVNISSTNKNSRIKLKMHHKEDDIIILRMSIRKTRQLIDEDANARSALTYPFVYVVVNLDPNDQSIYISEDSQAFYTNEYAGQQVEGYLDKDLSLEGLSIVLRPNIEKEEFWDFIKGDDIQVLDIEFIKPNMSRLRKLIPESFQKFSEKHNSQKTRIRFEAPKSGSLEKISKSDAELKGLIDYAAEGAGEVKFRRKGHKKFEKTSQIPVKIQVNIVLLEDVKADIFKEIKEIFKVKKNGKH